MIRLKITEDSSVRNGKQRETLLELDDATPEERGRILDAVLSILPAKAENVEIKLDGETIASTIATIHEMKQPGDGEPAAPKPLKCRRCEKDAPSLNWRKGAVCQACEDEMDGPPKIRIARGLEFILEHEEGQAIAIIEGAHYPEDDLEAMIVFEKDHGNRPAVLEALERKLEALNDPDPRDQIHPVHRKIIEQNAIRACKEIGSELSTEELHELRTAERLLKNRKTVVEHIDKLLALREPEAPADPDPYAEILAGDEREVISRITPDLRSDDLDELHRAEEAGENRARVRHHISGILAKRHAGSSGQEFNEEAARTFRTNPLTEERPGIGSIGEILESKLKRDPQQQLDPQLELGTKIVGEEIRFRCRVACPCGSTFRRYVHAGKKLVKCHGCGEHLRIVTAVVGADPLKPERDGFGNFYEAREIVERCEECGREKHEGPCPEGSSRIREEQG